MIHGPDDSIPITPSVAIPGSKLMDPMKMMLDAELESMSRRFWCSTFIARTELGDTPFAAAECADEARGRFMATFGGAE